MADIEFWHLVEDDAPLVSTWKVLKLVKTLLADKKNLSVLVCGCKVIRDSYP